MARDKQRAFLRLRDHAGEEDSVRSPDLPGSAAQRVKTAAIGSREDEANPVWQEWNGLEKVIHPFFCVESTEVQYERRPARLCEGPSRVGRLKSLLGERRRQDSDAVLRNLVRDQPIAIARRWDEDELDSTKRG